LQGRNFLVKRHKFNLILPSFIAIQGRATWGWNSDVWREKIMKLSYILALYLIWPAIVVVVWGELTPNPPHMVALFWDKLLHFTAYFGLAGLATVALNARKRAVWAVLALIALGGALEILQGFTGRDPDIYDELANTLGALSGGSVGWLLMATLGKKFNFPGRESGAALH
jgi:VanZ family protein